MFKFLSFLGTENWRMGNKFWERPRKSHERVHVKLTEENSFYKHLDSYEGLDKQ